MKRLIITITALGAFFGGTAIAMSQNTDALTLDNAIKLAIENNRSAKNARIEVEKQTDNLAAAKTHRLPTFKLDSLVSQPLSTFDTHFDKGVFGTYPGIGPVPFEDTTITSSTKPTAVTLLQIAQPLTQLKRIGLQIKQQELQRQISQSEVRETQQAIVNNVKRAYYAILQTQGQARAAEESVKLYEELDRVTGEYVMQQVALKTDQMDVQTRLAKAQYQLMTITNQMTEQKEQLNLLLGRDANVTFTVANEIETAQAMMRETDLTEARQRALAQRPEIREARLKMQQADLDLRAKKSEFIPDVSVTYNYVSTFNQSDFMPRSVSGVGVQIEWEFFDWGRKKHEVAEKTRTVSQANNSLLDIQNQVVMEVNSKFRDLREACELIRIARLAQTQARANVQLVAYKYKLDAVLLKDVLQAQTGLADANSDYQKALLSFWTAKADFEKALGEDK
ncbi:MAG TPA: TolC family protein [Pyrinomonadaceae bacterium]|nr:TolC family protein [Pyrinomonadaceae bacterium]